MRHLSVSLLAALLLPACGGPTCGPDGYTELVGKINPGVRVYYGPPGDRTYYGAIESTASSYTFPNGSTERGVLINIDGGGPTWHPRNNLLSSEWLVRCDDPALP
jgi:hypothetical protein